MTDQLERDGSTTAGDVVGGDKIEMGSIEGEGIAIGRNARVEINRYNEYIVRVDTLEELPPKPGEPPYKGLAYFTEADIFFGREQLSDDLAVRIETTRFLAVVGASGSGKSSILRAGLVPYLCGRSGFFPPECRLLTLSCAFLLNSFSVWPFATSAALSAGSVDGFPHPPTTMASADFCPLWADLPG